MLRERRILLALLASASVPFAGQAASVALDLASNAPYNDGWQTGDNGGYGWGGGWTLADIGGFSGHFTGSSTGNGDGDGNSDGDIDTSGRAWGQWAHTSNVASAVRPFSGSLSVGQTFSISYDNGWIDGGGVVGFGLQNSSGQNVFEYFFVGGNPAYTVSAGSYSGSTPGFTDEGWTLDFELTGTSTFALTIKTVNPANTFSGTGSLLNPGGGQAIDRVRIFNFNAGSGGQRDSFSSRIQIVPEPSSLLLVLGGVVPFVRRRR